VSPSTGGAAQRLDFSEDRCNVKPQTNDPHTTSAGLLPLPDTATRKEIAVSVIGGDEQPSLDSFHRPGLGKTLIHQCLDSLK
jgi:hypothetical protein